MPLPTTGPISLANIAAEFGGTAPHSVSEYYAAAAGVPGVGAVGIGAFRGKSAEIAITATNSASLDLSSAFGSDYGNPIAKRLVVPSNVILGPVSIPSGMSGSLTIENAGEIQGVGGGANGGNGGHAITAYESFSLLNTGAVRGGGGGGGKGGRGGAGRATSTVREPSSGGFGPNSSYKYRAEIRIPQFMPILQGIWEVVWDGRLISEGYRLRSGPPNSVVDPNDSSITYHLVPDSNNSPYAIYRTFSQQLTTSGGAGGDGGRGRGYNQSLSAGAAGAAGGTNAGDGGDGGSGGGFGQPGAGGSSGANGNYTNGSAGSAGGAAGRAVRMLAGTLTLNNSGVINGAT
jgi:hypothetical protein